MDNKVLEIVREAAMEKFASEAEVDAFMEGFEKEAFSPRTMARIVGGAERSIGALGVGLLGAGIVKGLNFSAGVMSKGALHSKFESALAQVMSTNRVVKGTDPAKVKQYAQTVFNFAPHVSADPNLLSSILANAVLGEGMDPITIKNLTELENRYISNNTPSPITGIRV